MYVRIISQMATAFFLFFHPACNFLSPRRARTGPSFGCNRVIRIHMLDEHRLMDLCAADKQCGYQGRAETGTFIANQGADGAAELLGVKPTTLLSRIKTMRLRGRFITLSSPLSSVRKTFALPSNLSRGDSKNLVMKRALKRPD
jgi:hypothetical protein